MIVVDTIAERLLHEILNGLALTDRAARITATVSVAALLEHRDWRCFAVERHGAGEVCQKQSRKSKEVSELHV